SGGEGSSVTFSRDSRATVGSAGWAQATRLRPRITQTLVVAASSTLRLRIDESIFLVGVARSTAELSFRPAAILLCNRLAAAIQTSELPSGRVCDADCGDHDEHVPLQRVRKVRAFVAFGP